MSLAAANTQFGPVPWTQGAFPIPGLVSGTIGSDATTAFTSAGLAIGVVFIATTTTMPDLVSFRVASVTTSGTTGNIEAEIQTIDTGSGNPTGTKVSGSNTGSATISTTGVKTISGMAGTASLVVGTAYAIVLTAGAGWDRSLTILQGTGTALGFGTPYLTTKSGGTWSKSGNGTTFGMCFGLADGSGNYFAMPGITGAYTATTENATDAIATDERGNRFTLPFPTRCIGAAFYVSNGTAPTETSNYAISLWATHTGTPNQLATVDWPGYLGTSRTPRVLIFPTPVDLSANTVYALTLKACGSTNQWMIKYIYSSNAELAALMGMDFYSTTRNGGAGSPANPGNSFTDGNTVVYGIAPLLSAFDSGGGGSGGVSRSRSVNA